MVREPVFLAAAALDELGEPGLAGLLATAAFNELRLYALNDLDSVGGRAMAALDELRTLSPG